MVIFKSTVQFAALILAGIEPSLPSHCRGVSGCVELSCLPGLNHTYQSYTVHSRCDGDYLISTYLINLHEYSHKMSETGPIAFAVMVLHIIISFWNSSHSLRT